MKCEICHNADAQTVLHRKKKDGTEEELYVCKSCAVAASRKKKSAAASKDPDTVVLNSGNEKPPPFVEDLLKATLGFVKGIAEAQDKADAVFLAWYPGARGGRAVAELLFGKASPSGKLPVTFYRNAALSELPEFTDYSMRQRTYKYYTGEPLYPFGYGLSYADMVLTGLSADRSAARVTVTNRSSFAAGETVELYVRDEDSPDAPTNPVLAGFGRVRLEAGESRELTLALDPRAFTGVGEDGVRRPGSGRWTVYAGFGQPDRRTEELTGKASLRAEVT